MRDVDHDDVITAQVGEPAKEVIERAEKDGHTWVVVVDRAGRPRAWPSLNELRSKSEVSDYLDRRLPVVAQSSTLNDALDAMLAASQGAALVTDGRGAVIGSLSIDSVTDTIRTKLAEVQSDEHTYESHVIGSDSTSTPVIAADDEPHVVADAESGSGTSS